MAQKHFEGKEGGKACHPELIQKEGLSAKKIGTQEK